MTKSEIKNYHRVIAYVNLSLSVMHLIFSRNSDISGRLFEAILINLGYHMLYYYFALIYKLTTKVRLLNKFNKVALLIMLKLFAIFGILGSASFGILTIFDAIDSSKLHELFGICIPFGMFLGANSLLRDIQEESQSFMA
jgi:hypothetical protein